MKVKPWFDGENHARLQLCIDVHLTTSLSAVVHIKAKVVAGAVNHPATVKLVVGFERLFCANWQQAPLGGLVRDYLHCSSVNLAELHSRLCNLEGRVGCLANCLVDHFLGRVELAIDRQSARHIRCVKTVNLNAGV